MQNIWQTDKYYEIAKNASTDLGHPAIKKLKTIALSCAKILEVGCGEGSKLNIIAPKGAQAYGVDISTKAIELAKRQYPKHQFKVANGEKLPFSSVDFDLVFSAFTLEHTDNPDLCIEEMIRVLQPKGILALLAPNYGAPFRKSPCFRGNRVIRVIKGIVKDFASTNKSAYLKWQKVEPIQTEDFTIDQDTSVEPYLGSLITFLNHKHGKIITASSCWEVKEESESLLNKCFRSLGKGQIYPFTYWGPHLFVLWQKQ